MGEPHNGLPCDGCDNCRHEHKWRDGPTTYQHYESCSPCSTWDDILAELIVMTQTCECGETRRLCLGYRNQRRRGDDLRRRAGREPLGTPLPRSETFRRPRIMR
jgi:hypothetical protein